MNIKNFEPNEVHLLGYHDLPSGFLSPSHPHIYSLGIRPYLDEQQGCGFCFSLGEWHSYQSVFSFQDDCCVSFLPSISLSYVLSSWIIGPLQHTRPSWSSTRLPALCFPWVIHSTWFWPMPHRNQLHNDIPCCKFRGMYTRAGRKAVVVWTDFLVTLGEALHISEHWGPLL